MRSKFLVIFIMTFCIKTSSFSFQEEHKTKLSNDFMEENVQTNNQEKNFILEESKSSENALEKNNLQEKVYDRAGFIPQENDKNTGDEIEMDNEKEIKINNKKYDQGHSSSKNKMSSKYNSSARVEVKKPWGTFDFFIMASFIYWQAKERGVDVAVYIDIDGDDVTYSLVNMHFNFKPGFKVGLGMHFDYDDWNAWLEYTRLNTRNSASKEDFSSDLAPIWFEDVFGCVYTKGVWKLFYNMLDSKLSRFFYVGNKFSVEPYTGARLGFIGQKYISKILIINEDPNNNRNTHAKSDSWLLGPIIGINSSWHLPKGFRFLVTGASSIFYQDFDTVINIERPQMGAMEKATWKYKDKKGYVNASFETALGFGWNRYLHRDRYHIDISLQYEFLYFLNQNMIRRLLDKMKVNYVKKASDLSLNGLTFSTKFDF